jgi:hypothetical protein
MDAAMARRPDERIFVDSQSRMVFRDSDLVIRKELLKESIEKKSQSSRVEVLKKEKCRGIDVAKVG